MSKNNAVWRRRGAIAVVVCVAAIASGACTRAKEPDLALVCQLKKCVCKPLGYTLFTKSDDREVLWKQNGDAYCAKGYVLRPAE